MERSYQLSNRLNMETGQWEYAPRNVTVERGRVQVDEGDDLEVCRECGKSEAGSCFFCKMD